MRSASEGGFTLVELLIAVALMGMFTFLAYASVRFADLAWRHNEERREADADKMAVAAVFRHSLGSAYPAFASAVYSDRSVAFTGNSADLSLIAPLTQAIEAGVMESEHFYLAPDDRSTSLFMAWQLDLPSAPGRHEAPRVTRLAKQVTALRLAYFGVVQAGKPAQWVDRWAGQSAFPELVRAQLWRVHTGSAAWLDLVVGVSTTTNVDCVYDPLDNLCRRLE